MTVRRLFLYDAAFEAALAALLVAGVAAGWLSGADFASPATTGAVLGFAVGLALLAAALVSLARERPGRAPVLVLSLANEAVAMVGLLWVLTAHGFSASGQAIVWLTIASLALLSALQLRAVVRFGR